MVHALQNIGLFVHIPVPAFFVDDIMLHGLMGLRSKAAPCGNFLEVVFDIASFNRDAPPGCDRSLQCITGARFDVNLRDNGILDGCSK